MTNMISGLTKSFFGIVGGLSVAAGAVALSKRVSKETALVFVGLGALAAGIAYATSYFKSSKKEIGHKEASKTQETQQASSSSSNPTYFVGTEPIVTRIEIRHRHEHYSGVYLGNGSRIDERVTDEQKADQGKYINEITHRYEFLLGSQNDNTLELSGVQIGKGIPYHIAYPAIVKAVLRHQQENPTAGGFISKIEIIVSKQNDAITQAKTSLDELVDKPEYSLRKG